MRHSFPEFHGALFMRRTLLVFAIAGVALAACNKVAPQQPPVSSSPVADDVQPPPYDQAAQDAADEQARISGEGAFIDTLMGVWSRNGLALWVMGFNDAHLMLTVNGNPLDARLGEIDFKNDTINLYVKGEGGRELTWTLRRMWNADHTGFSMLVTFADGQQGTLGFVRELTEKDFNTLRAAYPAVSSVATDGEDDAPDNH